ncbi:MAG: alpha/beta fold hydrolase [Acidimicrobiales bacterium]
MLHGQPGSGSDWARVAEELFMDHRVIAPDRPGWGGHPRPATGIAENARGLDLLLDSCGASAPVTVVGHSLGGGVGLELALQRPELVGALVLVASVGVEGAVSELDRLLAMPFVGEGALRAGLAAFGRAADVLGRSAREHTRAESDSAGGRVADGRSGRDEARWAGKVPGRPRRLRSFLEATTTEPMNSRERSTFLREQRALVEETPSLSRRLSQLRLPVAVVSGSADHVVPLGAARALSESIPGAELVVAKGEGHLLIRDRPELIARVVRRYAALSGPG